MNTTSNYMARHSLHYGKHNEFPFIKTIHQDVHEDYFVGN